MVRLDFAQQKAAPVSRGGLANAEMIPTLLLTFNAAVKRSDQRFPLPDWDVEVQKLLALGHELHRIAVAPVGRIGMPPKGGALAKATGIPGFNQADARQDHGGRILLVRVREHDIAGRFTGSGSGSVFPAA